MNPGYLSLIWMVMTVILLASGWKDVFLRDVPNGKIAVFFALWLPLSFLPVEVGRITIYGIYPLLAIIGLYGLAARDAGQRRLQMVTAIILLGTVDFGMRQTEGIAAPAMPDSSFVLAVAVTLLVRRPAKQIAVLSLSLLLSSAMFLYVTGGRLPSVLGDARFQDHWWMTVCLARIWTVLAEGIAAAAKAGYSSILERTRQWRK
ncbi:hypothetical protein [Paenibacillus sp. MBLB4367]|uniref:hypothetical protein n=1 Tax=Paenibacillus sp. MBLB4367 TaxID=3384767 RepID=UPI003908308A